MKARLRPDGGVANPRNTFGIVTLQFGADLGMLIICSLWGIWHIASGLLMVVYWRCLDALNAAQVS